MTPVEYGVHLSGAAVWQHHRMESDVDQVITAQRDAVIAWMNGPDARGFARSLLRTLGPVAADLVDDLVQEAVHAVLVRFSRLDAPLFDGDVAAPKKYGTTVLKSKAADIMTGTIEARNEVASFDELVERDADLEGLIALSGGADDGRLVDLMRMAVLAAPAGDTVRSAALTYLALDDEPTVPKGWGIPLPKAGANATERKKWPGLWLAGQHSLFDRDDSVARRKKRSREGVKVAALLHDAVAELQVQGLVSGGSAREAH